MQHGLPEAQQPQHRYHQPRNNNTHANNTNTRLHHRSDVDKQRFKARGFAFRPARGWLGGEQRERVDGWDCAVYEASGCLVGVSTAKAAWGLAATAPFEDYLALAPRGDGVREVAFDPYDPGTYDPLGAARREGDDDDDDNEEEGQEDLEALDAALAAELAGGEPGAADGGGSGSGSGWWWQRRGQRSGGGGGGEDEAAAGADDFADAFADDAGSSEGASDDDAGDGAAGRHSQQRQNSGASPASASAARRAVGAGGSSSGGINGSGSGRRGKVEGDRAAKGRDKAKQPKTKAKRKAGGGRTLRARLWMARGFPMRLAQLVPLLEVVGAANRRLAKVAAFLRTHDDAALLGLFPVRLQVPLLLTVHAAVGVADFRELPPGEAPPPAFFAVPDAYARRLLNDMLDKHTGGLLGAGPGGRRRRGAGGGDDSDEGGLFGGDFDWM